MSDIPITTVFWTTVWMFGIGFVSGWAVGHYEALRCSCPKVKKEESK